MRGQRMIKIIFRLKIARVLTKSWKFDVGQTWRRNQF